MQPLHTFLPSPVYPPTLPPVGVVMWVMTYSGQKTTLRAILACIIFIHIVNFDPFTWLLRYSHDMTSLELSAGDVEVKVNVPQEVFLSCQPACVKRTLEGMTSSAVVPDVLPELSNLTDLLPYLETFMSLPVINPHPYRYSCTTE